MRSCVRLCTVLPLLAITACGGSADQTPTPPPTTNPSAAQLRISTSADTAGGLAMQNGVTLSTAIAVSVRDAAGRAIDASGMPVAVAFISPTGTISTETQVTGTASATTDNSGIALFSSVAVKGKAENGKLRFTSGTLTPAEVSVRIAPGNPSASRSTFRVTADTIAAGERASASVQLFDADGNKIGAGRTVTISSVGGSAAGTWSAVTFAPADSSYQADFVAVTPGSSSIASVSADGVSLNTTRTVTVRAVAVAGLTFTVNTAVTFPISRFIYGANFIDDVGSWGGATPPRELTVNRFGGNRLSAFNWENSFSNSGIDSDYSNDRHLNTFSTVAGQAVSARADLSFGRNQAFIATVPMLGYVAGDACNCNVGTSDADRTRRLSTHFKISRAFKRAPFNAVPDTTDGFVYQDEFVNWWEKLYPGRATHATAPVFFTLDNEPDAWHATHREIQSYLNDNSATPRIQTYDGLSDTSIVYARAIKSVSPNALVFGPGLATYAGYVTAGRYPTPDPRYGNANFIDVYLDKMRVAETTYGRRLLDVLDLHWYAEAGAGGYSVSNDYAPQDSTMIELRMQSPRSLWDPTYTEPSWVSDVTAGPIRLLPRLKDQIAVHYPGTKIAITEYYYGRGGDISGGIAQADVLGIFGREGVFAATLWPNAGIYAQPYLGDGNKAYAYVFAAFRMFLNYDGAGARFGDTGLQATTTDVAGTSVYASRNASGQLVLVAINKARTPRTVNLVVQGNTAMTRANVFALTGASAVPARGTDLTFSANRTTYTMPALSVSTLVVVP